MVETFLSSPINPHDRARAKPLEAASKYTIASNWYFMNSRSSDLNRTLFLTLAFIRFLSLYIFIYISVSPHRLHFFNFLPSLFHVISPTPSLLQHLDNPIDLLLPLSPDKIPLSHVIADVHCPLSSSFLPYGMVKSSSIMHLCVCACRIYVDRKKRN